MSIDLIKQELRIVYMTTDGKIFFDRNECLNHQEELENTRITEEELKESFEKYELGEL